MRIKRQTSTNTTPPANIKIDFGAASAEVAQVLDPEVYELKIESARVVQSNQSGNTLIVLDLITIEGGVRVALQPLLVDGPNADAGRFAAENRHLIAQLLTLAGRPTVGPVHDLVAELVGLSFEARLVLSVDNRSGRTFNAIAEVFAEDTP